MSVPRIADTIVWLAAGFISDPGLSAALHVRYRPWPVVVPATLSSAGRGSDHSNQRGFILNL